MIESNSNGGVMPKAAEWIFQEPPEYGGGDLKGDVVKMFRGELRSLPGFLGARQPGASATLFIRELIQNSMDAHFEWAKGHPSSNRLELELMFNELSGKELERFTTATDLSALLDRANSPDVDGKLGLTEECWLGNANVNLPLKVLRVSERGTTGMYGPWRRSDANVRKMVAALLEFGNNEKPIDAGGSYGFGKIGLVKASRARIVIAYTCYESPAPDNGATRRLYGVAYWGQHKLRRKEYTGFAGFGMPVADPGAAAAGLTEPFINEVADEIAESLGLDVRSVGGEPGCGTSFIIIDPDFDAAELKNAIEIYWWPALLRNHLWTTVIGSDGIELPPRPKIDPDLKPFTEALEYAEGKTKPPSSRPCRAEQFKYLGKTLGNLGMVIDDSPGSWSYSDDPNESSMAALVRKTGLVIKYETTSTALPKVRGVFSASDEVNDILRLSEPKAHDEWVDMKDSDIPEESRKFAKKVKEDVRKGLRDFAAKFAPRPDRPAAILKHFNTYFSGLKPGVTPPRPSSRDPWEIAFGEIDLESSGSGTTVCQTAEVGISLKNGVDPVDVVVEFGFGAIEGDGRFNKLLLGCGVTAIPAGFDLIEPASNAYRGVLDSAHTKTFGLKSSEYSSDWQCGFEVTVTPFVDWVKSPAPDGEDR